MTETQRNIEPAVPVLWLIGKTGAGKTSLVRALTGEGAVGNGFAPGTRAAMVHDFPAVAPVAAGVISRRRGRGARAAA